MDIDSDLRRRGEFPVDKPMEALRTDHHFGRQYFDRYFQCQDTDEKKAVGRHNLLLLEMHAALEEGVFYLRVHKVDPSLVEHIDAEEQQLFPKIGQAHLDLTAIGQEMQTFEITMIADRLQKPVTSGIRI